MILKRNTTRRMTWPVTTALAAIGLLVLPVSLHTLWAEPPAEEGVEVAVEAEVADTVEAEEIEENVEPAVAGEAQGEIEIEVDPAVVEVVEIEEAEDEAERAEAVNPAIERRLERLERMIEKLVGAHQANAMRKPDADSKSAPIPPSPATESDVRGAYGMKTVAELERELDHSYADLVRDATRNLELSKTNLNRLIAAQRQEEAVVKAYQHESVSADQVL